MWRRENILLLPLDTSSPRADNLIMKKVEKTEEEWKSELTPEQYRVVRQKGTERPFSGEYVHTKEPGVYLCVACGQELFSSSAKYDSGSGWPSFFEPVAKENLETAEDTSHFMKRTEIMCSRCGSHLGHVFEDGPQPTGQRYCVNSASLRLEKKKEG